MREDGEVEMLTYISRILDEQTGFLDECMNENMHRCYRVFEAKDSFGTP